VFPGGAFRHTCGLLTKLIAKVSQSLKVPYDELPEQLAREALLGVDETGHKENGSRLWTWCFRAATYTLFKIDPSRGSEVLLDVLAVILLAQDKLFEQRNLSVMGVVLSYFVGVLFRFGVASRSAV